MQDRPEAPELLEALAAMLVDDVLPHVPAELELRLRAAAQVCSTLGREWPADDAAVRAEAGRLVALIGRRPAEPARSWAELRAQTWGLRRETARALRSGELDGRLAAARTTLRESVRDKLAVAHPGYDTVADDGR